MTIYNPERLNQHFDFEALPFFATDIDSVTHILGRVWLFNEAKTEGTDITRGQEILAKDLVKGLGANQPTFFLITHHDTRPTETITGHNLMVSTVYFKAPHINKVVVHDYEAHQRPTLKKFMEILAFVAGLEDKLKRGHLIRVEDDPFFDQFPNLRPDIIHALSNDEMMQSFADMEFWDEFTPEQTAFMYACKAFDEMDFYSTHYKTWVSHVDSHPHLPTQ